MRLSSRLKTIYDMVPKSTRLADIGTDHAYLPAALVKGGKAEAVIATDLRAAPLKGAERYLRSHGLLERIELRQGDGLTVLSPGEVEGMIMSGLGGGTLVKMLEAAPHVLASLRYVLLAPQNDAYLLRAFFLRTAFALVDERLIQEEGRFYPILCFAPGDALQPYRLNNYSFYEALYVGPFLLSRGGLLMKRYLENELAQTVRIREQIEKRSTYEHRERRLLTFTRQEKLLRRRILALEENARSSRTDKRR
ncbi:MAG: putative tRNA-m1A22 methylase [Candidatus Carbobacillus altaicus]|uniref:Putative tRNA-m1A22 methylase n=1 Tax=Candidatus Carbonibacillus altaicus TaxID=2163959 RepID=A0A2R6Y2X9_9BACL|nr:MAG: putative tRNA-m1A22 methylase [Candidatus Carbobacillus altaicus]